MDDKHLVAVIDFGSQYTQLIVRRVRELGYMAKLYALEDLDQIHEPGAVILSGGPKSTTDADAPDIDFEWLQSLNVPVLGVCYGMQLLNIKHGGTVKASNKREYGPAALLPETCAGLYRDMSPSSQVWMSHSDTVDHLAEGCRVIARNAEGVPVSLQWGETTFGIQFHPEVTHSHEGRTILRNFLSCAANLKKFDIGDFKRELIREIRERVGDKQVVCGVSGGVDSTVLAVLLHEAGVNMRAIFVDNGLLRKNEAEEVRANFARMNVEIETVDASERFLAALDGESDPEKKRRIIGGLFIDVFWDAVGDAEMLAQGTLYPDVIESASNAKSKASVIKTHHNRVERVLELQAQGKVLEPLAELFKDEVRRVGTELGLPDSVVQRQPFPGPGLAIRIMGEVTREKLETLRDADFIFREEIAKAGLSREIWQYFAVITNSKTVGVQGDFRTYENVIALRAVTSVDAMTADWARIPYDVLEKISNRITNEVPHANRIVYDITSKPPATIEWE